MRIRLTKWWLSGLCPFIFYSAFAQIQACPANVNFSYGTLTHWYAYTGNNAGGNGPSAIRQTYDSTVAAPSGTTGNSRIPEYLLSTVAGIQVKTTTGRDLYGGFSTIPIINGYSYGYSILIGSTSVAQAQQAGPQEGGGYIRGISYKINVPPGPVTIPYTMTYAYAMVLENGTHNSDQQPMFSATLTTPDSVISCASPSYLLPTLNNATTGGNGATLDTAAALREGFSHSVQPSPNIIGNNRTFLFDVWTKGWTEVTFDLSPYRGQQVTLTFESDNCVPGGHFAYAYVALRNTCAGLQISGDSSVCTNSDFTYSVPSLTNATYQWAVPSSWTIISGATTNIIDVTAGNTGGPISVEEENSCADLKDTISVATTTPGVGGTVAANAEVCTGINNTILSLSGNTGNVIAWVSSADSVNWNNIAVTSGIYTVQNLTQTTLYAAVVQTGAACAPDTSSAALITIDQKSIGGRSNPDSINICFGQTSSNTLSLTGYRGVVTDWQSSPDNTNWTNIIPADRDSLYGVNNISGITYYRAVVQNGVCPADNSTDTYVQYYSSPYPQATIDPTDTAVCYGQTVSVNAVITLGTNYNWVHTAPLINQGNGIVTSTPYTINATASPAVTTNYILNVEDAGCPNTLSDTAHIVVIPAYTINTGNDTVVVAGEPLQLDAISTDVIADTYTWTPPLYLSSTTIQDPVATFGPEANYQQYIVKAIDSAGCAAIDTINVKIYDVNANLYVPNAFTPNGDGLNDNFKPILLGMRSLTRFDIYNRWGQLVFSTTQEGNGWDGTYQGNPQPMDSYVWIAQGIDYHGTFIQQKGNVLLIR